MVRVTVSPALALVVSELLEAMLTVVIVGAVLSIVTVLESVVAVTVDPALPVASEKLETENATVPSLSLTVYVAV